MSTSPSLRPSGCGWPRPIPRLRACSSGGYRVLVDRIGLADLETPAVATEPEHGLPTRRELDDVASDFSYHALWAAKKLSREKC